MEYRLEFSRDWDYGSQSSIVIEEDEEVGMHKVVEGNEVGTRRPL